MVREGSGKLVGSQCPVCPVPTTGVVEQLVGGQTAPCIGEREKPVLIQTLVAHAAVEAFHEGILIRLAGLDVQELHAVMQRPAHDVLPDEFGPIITEGPASDSRVRPRWRSAPAPREHLGTTCRP